MKKLVISKNVIDRKAESVERYMNDVLKRKMISHEDEVELARRIKMGDSKAMETLVSSNLRFVISVAKRYKNQGLPLLDLISEGNIGLIKAAYKFDETRGFKFISYAVWWIRRAIIEALMEYSRIIRIPQSKMDRYYKICASITRLEQMQGRQPSMEEVAADMKISENDVIEIYRRINNKISIDAPLYDNEEESVIDLIADDSIRPADNSLIKESIKKDMTRVLDKLSKREKDIIRMYFGLNGMSYTLGEIADIIGLSSERVRNIKDNTLMKMRYAKDSNKLLVQYLC